MRGLAPDAGATAIELRRATHLLTCCRASVSDGVRDSGGVGAAPRGSARNDLARAGVRGEALGGTSLAMGRAMTFPSSNSSLLVFLSASVLASLQGGCVEDETEDESPFGSYEQPIWAGIEIDAATTGCTAKQRDNLVGALYRLRDQVHPTFGGNAYLTCLKDAITNTAWDLGRTPEQMYKFSNVPGKLTISCEDLDPPAWGQAEHGDGDQYIKMDRRQIDMIRNADGTLNAWQELNVGAVILHELFHVSAGGGADHSVTTGTRDYNTTINNIVQSCVVNRTSAAMRSTIRGKVELAWAGGGRPHNVPSADLVSSATCDDRQAAMGLTVTRDSGTVYRVALQCATPLASGWSSSSIAGTGVGGAGGTEATQSCRSDSMLAGLSLRFRGDYNQAQLEQVGGTCMPVAQIRSPGPFSSVSFLGPWGGTTGEVAQRGCPAGSVVVGVRGHLRGSARRVQALQPICRPIAEVGRRERQMVATGTPVGGGGGSPSLLRCPGNSIATGLTGDAGSVVRRLGLVCVDHDIDNRDSLGTNYTISEIVGGQTDGSFERYCSSPDVRTALVGFAFRSGTRIDRITPVCAIPSQWRAGVTTTFDDAPVGGSGGGVSRRICPQGRFVVGLKARSGSDIDQLQVLCSDQSSPRLP